MFKNPTGQVLTKKLQPMEKVPLLPMDAENKFDSLHISACKTKVPQK